MTEYENINVVVCDDLDEEEVKALRLADNKTSEKSEWDFDLLDIELSGIIGFDMADFGFDVPEMILNAEEDEYIAEVQKEAKSKRV